MRVLRRRTVEIGVDGHRFRVTATPSTRQVEWLTCPSDTFPNGYSSKTFAVADSWLATWAARLRLVLVTPLPSDDELRAEVTQWLRETLESQDK